jgi:hypothetical protein
MNEGSNMQLQQICKQKGISLVGLIVILAIVGFFAVLGLKIVPSISEYSAVKNAIAKAKSVGGTPNEMRFAFDKAASVAYIETISGKDLDITKVGDEWEVSFAYDKKIPLVGPASLLIEYAGSTAKNRPAAAKGS